MRGWVEFFSPVRSPLLITILCFYYFFCALK